MSKTFLITGANAGLGLDATRQLALQDDVAKVYLACRSKDKAEKAIEGLVAAGVSKDKLEFIGFNASASKAEIEAAAVLPSGTVLDGVVLNAGGVGSDTVGKPTKPNNVLPIVQINIAGHAHLVNHLLQKGNIADNKTRIIFSGSEGARGISIMGMPAPKLDGDSVDYFKSHLDGSIYKKYDAFDVYSAMKGMGSLYFSGWARAHPDVFAMTVSPGGTKGTSFTTQESVPLVMKYLFPVIMTIVGWFGGMHDLDVGAKRYVDAVRGEGDFKDAKSGDFYASKSKAAAGPSVNQADYFESAKQYADVKKQDAMYAAMNSFL